MKTKMFALAVSAVLAMGALAGCGGQQTASTDTQAEPQYKYVSVQEFKDEIKEKDDSDPIILDVRKAEDHQKDGLEGSIGADMDAAKGGDMETGKQNMTKALEEAGLMKNGKLVENDKDIVLVCYSGKSYAEAATKVLDEMGYNMDDVATLEGGMKALGVDK